MMDTLIRKKYLLHSNGLYLDHLHLLQSRVADIPSEKMLRHHIIIYHGMSDKGHSLKELAKNHLLYHAVTAFPQLRQLWTSDEDWGKAL